MESNLQEQIVPPNAIQTNAHVDLTGINYKLLSLGLLITVLVLSYFLYTTKSSKQTDTAYAPAPTDTLEIAPTMEKELVVVPLEKQIQTTCGFTIGYPVGWQGEQSFITTKIGDCVYLTAPDYAFSGDTREGLYVQVTRKQMKSLEDYIQYEESFIEPKTSVANKVNEIIGTYEGISYNGLGFNAGKSFIFYQGNFVYEVNYPAITSEQDIQTVESIIASITF